MRWSCIKMTCWSISTYDVFILKKTNKTNLFIPLLYVRLACFMVLGGDTHACSASGAWPRVRCLLFAAWVISCNESWWDVTGIPRARRFPSAEDCWVRRTPSFTHLVPPTQLSVWQSCSSVRLHFAAQIELLYIKFSQFK